MKNVMSSGRKRKKMRAINELLSHDSGIDAFFQTAYVGFAVILAAGAAVCITVTVIAVKLLNKKLGRQEHEKDDDKR